MRVSGDLGLTHKPHPTGDEVNEGCAGRTCVTDLLSSSPPPPPSQAMCNDKYVGAIVCKLEMHHYNTKRGYIAMLAVDRDYRKRKIGE